MKIKIPTLISIILIVLFFGCNDEPETIASRQPGSTNSVSPGNSLKSSTDGSARKPGKSGQRVASSVQKTNYRFYFPFYYAYIGQGTPTQLTFDLDFDVLQVSLSPGVGGHEPNGGFDGVANLIEPIEVPYTISRPFTYTLSGLAAEMCEVTPVPNSSFDWYNISIKSRVFIHGYLCGETIVNFGDTIGTIVFHTTVDGVNVDTPPLPLIAAHAVAACYPHSTPVP